jgi:hypothetical protein
MTTSRSIRRFAAAAALSLAVLAPAAHAYAAAPQGPGDIAPAPHHQPPTGPGDITNGQGGDPDPCPPIKCDLENPQGHGDPDPCPPISCDLTSNPGDDGGTDNGGDGSGESGESVDQPVPANPTFAG